MKEQLQTPDEIRQHIWKELGRAALDRHHEWRTPVLATCAADGLPNARTVVLRAVDSDASRLEMYTDARSPKTAELMAQPQAMLVFWSSRLSWQLRMRANMDVLTQGERVDALWQRVKQSPSAGDYLSALAPGSELQASIPTGARTQQKNHFCLLSAQVMEMDWLELSRNGHRRAKIAADGTLNSWQWLTP